MLRCWLCRLLFLCLVFPANGQTLSHRTVSIDNDWRFHLGDAADPHRDFGYGLETIFSKSGKATGTAIDPRFNDSAWDPVRLPHDWAESLPFVSSDNFDVAAHGFKPVGARYPQTSIGWYRKHLTVQPSDSGARFVLQFDGIYRDAQIWINGFYLGRNMSGYLGVSYDVTDYLDFRHDNVLVVRVDATQYEGWFYEGAGIYRHAWLHTYQPLYVPSDGLFVHTDVAEPAPGGSAKTAAAPATVHVETTLTNTRFQSDTCTLVTTLTTRDGQPIGAPAFTTLKLPVSAPSDATIQVPQPRLWSPDDPYLYRATVLVMQNGQVLDSTTRRFGIKTVRIDPEQGLFLNGAHLEIKGANCHPDHAGVGSALPDALQYYRVRLLKAMGVNAYRTAHYAPAPELLDACDSLGLLVLDENRLVNSSPEYMDQWERLIRRDRSRACVFLWSIGNEEGYIQTQATGRRIAETLIARQRQLDPTRTCTYAADLPNVYRGINEVIPIRGFNYRQFAVSDYHRDHPGQPILGTEMGSTVTTRGVYNPDPVTGEYRADSARGYLPDQDISAPWWASRAETWWTLAAAQPWWMGGFVWTGFDYRGEPTPFLWPVIHSHFGLMDDCGFPKNIYYYYQSWWTDKDVLHLSPHWNWKGREGKPIAVWVNSNADRVELRLNGKSLGEKPMPRNGHLEWKVSYTPGKLEAIGHKSGRVIKTFVETTGPPARVVLEPDTTWLRADGRDALVVNVHVVDRQGRAVPDAQDLIHFSLTGAPAFFIGTGNGDPSSHEPDQYPAGAWQRHLFNGKCQVILQATGGPDITVRAEAVGLQAGEATIRTGP